MIERRAAGQLPDKPHTALRGPDDSLRYEQCLTREGFDGPFTMLYHEGRPHVMEPVDLEPGFGAPRAAEPAALRRRHYQSDRALVGGPPSRARTPLLFNEDVVVSVLGPDADDPHYVSNADGDDLFFIREGRGTLRSQFGDLPFEPGDYVVVPRGILHRFVLGEGLEFRLVARP